MAPRKFVNRKGAGNMVMDVRQLLQNKKQGSFNANTKQRGLGLNFNLRNKLKASKGSRNGFQGKINLPATARLGYGRQNQHFQLTNAGLVRKQTNIKNRMPPNLNQNRASSVKNPGKRVQLVGSKLIVTRKQGAAAVRMGRNGIPQRIIRNNNNSRVNLEEDNDQESLENLRKAQILKHHLLQSLQERLTQPSVIASPPALPKPTSCALLVTNLHPSVTEEDVIELFSDVGLISSAKLGQPGTAVVVYQNPEDAEKAKEVYHNRQLDGIPMSCVLLPINQTTSAKRNITARLGGKITSPRAVSSPMHLPSHAILPPMHLPSPSTSAFNRRNFYANPSNSKDVVFTVKLQ